MSCLAVPRAAASVGDGAVSTDAQTMVKREAIAWQSSTHKSVEEIATTILRDLGPDRVVNRVQRRSCSIPATEEQRRSPRC
jgi:hypothetical protein